MDAKKIQVLLVEDNPGDARLIQEALAERGDGAFRLHWAKTLAEGIRRLLTGPDVDLVLLDLSLPGTRGLDTLARLLDQGADVPVIVLTGLDDEALAVEAVRRGAQDYLVKGQTSGPLLARAIRYAIERKEAQAELAAANARLAEANRRLAELATTDDLTGLWNRRHFFEVFEHETRRLARTGGDLALVMLDVDHFKRVNDTWGHPFGDRVLAHVAAVLRREAREVDLVARFGGEEFVVLMPGTTLAQAATAGERFRRAIEAAPLRRDDGPASVTVSVGVAACASPGEAAHLLRHVDEALYAAKRAGRNCTMLWTPEGPACVGEVAGATTQGPASDPAHAPPASCITPGASASTPAAPLGAGRPP